MRDSLDLCLSCKACSADCPAGVDMARYKSEVAYRAYRWRLRPRSHYALGQLPRAGPGGPGPRPGWPTRCCGSGRWPPRCSPPGGMDTRRAIPSFAEVPFRRSAARRAATTRPSGPRPAISPAPGSSERPVVLWADSFSDAFKTAVPQAALRVLTQAGYQVIVPERRPAAG